MPLSCLILGTLIRAQIVSPVDIVLYSRHDIGSEIRKIWGERVGRIARNQAKRPSLDPKSIAKDLEAEGYIVNSQDGMIVGVDKELPMFRSARDTVLLAQLLGELDSDGVTMVSHDGSPAARQAFDTAVAAWPGKQPSKLAVAVTPTFLLINGERSSGDFAIIDIRPGVDAMAKLKASPIRMSGPTNSYSPGDDGRARIPTTQPTRGIHINWSPTVTTPEQLEKASHIFATVWADQLEQMRSAKYSIENYESRKFGNKMGSGLESGRLDLSHLSPWLRGQVLDAIDEKFASLGFGSAVDARAALDTGGSLHLQLNFSLVFGLDDGSGHIGTYTRTGN